jgi:DNA-binding protein HU-beta
VNKAELIEAVAAHYDGSKSEAAKALNAVVKTITYKTAAGEKVSITGFGIFEKVHRSARMVRNPRTGERKRAKATAVPRFRAGTDLKAYVSGAKKVPKAPTKKAVAEAAKATTVKTAAAAKTTAAKTTAAKTTPATKTPAKPTSSTVTPTKASSAKTATAKATTAKASPAKSSPAKKAAAKRTTATTTAAAKKAPAKKAAGS